MTKILPAADGRTDSGFPSGRERLGCFNVRKLGWYAVSAVVAAMILGGVLLLAANLYVQSLTVQARIRQALVSALKMPVEIKKTTLTPWEGLRIDGITAHPEGSTENFLTAQSFRVQFALLPLFHKSLTVQQVLLDQPDLAWAQNADGRWQFPPETIPAAKPPTPPVPPEQEAPIEPPVQPGEAPGPVVPPVAEATPDVAPPARQAKPAGKPDHGSYQVAVDVDRLKLRHGVLNFLDSHRRLVGRFEEVNLDTRLKGTDHAAGALWFGKAMLPRAGVTFTDFHSDFTYDKRGLNLAHGSGKFAGGKVDLSCRIGLQEPGTPFETACHIEDVSLDELVKEAGGRPKFAEGRLRGDIQAAGLAGDRESRRASGLVQLVNARFTNLPLLQTIGDALRIEDISHLEFKKAELDYALEGTILHVKPLTLVSNNLQIAAQGDYDTEADRLVLRARLTIDRAVGRQLPQFVESNFLPCGSGAPEGSRYMDFDITGTLNKPRSDLFAKVLQGSAASLLENLFAPKKKHEKKAPKQQQPPGEQNNGSGDGI